MRLAQAFVRAAPAHGPADADLEARLAGMVEAGRAAWPGVALDPDEYVRHLAERLPDEPGALARVYAADLYLACACAKGDAAALRELDRAFIVPLAKYLMRGDALAGFGDDLKQMVRERLLVAGGGLAPRIGRYAGQGPLKSWLRMAAVRVAIDLQRSFGPPAAPAEEPIVAPDAEVRYLKSRYGDEFRAAFEATLGKLSVREGNVLRLYFLDGMDAPAIGALYQVSRRTVHRWLNETRRKILEETQRRVRRRVPLSTSQFDTLVTCFKTELGAGLRKFSKKSEA